MERGAGLCERVLRPKEKKDELEEDFEDAEARSREEEEVDTSEGVEDEEPGDGL